MKTMKTLLISSALLVAMSSNVFAGEGRAHGPYRNLQLTEQQQLELRKIQQDYLQERKASAQGDGVRSEKMAQKDKHKGDKPTNEKRKDEKRAQDKVGNKRAPHPHAEQAAALQALIQAERFDEVAVRALLEQDNKTRIEAQIKRAQMQHAMYQVLTQEQKDILAAEQKTRQKPLIRS